MTKFVTPEDIIDEHLPHIQKLTQELRKLITQTIPEASEKAYSIWHGIVFRYQKIHCLQTPSPSPTRFLI